MPILPMPLASAGEAATIWLFGGNILAPRAPMTGPGSYAEAVEALGVTGVRYPGGSLTESYFDLSNPDATTVVHNETGEEQDFMPLSDVMAYAEETGRAVTIVLPTREQVSTRFDDNGDRFADVDEAELRGFVRDVVTGEYGNAPVAGLEIGNEYWGSGRMNAVEYGRVAAEMTRIIDAELQALAPLYPDAADIDILVQMGTNFGDSSLDEAYEGMSNPEIIADLNATYGLDLPPGRGVDWTEFNNLLVIEQFDPQELAAVDGVIAHVYSRGADMPHTRYFALDQIQDTWFEETPDLEIHVTEWNLRSNSDSLVDDRDYGLFQAQEMLEQVEAFMAEGVDAAQVWPLIQNTPSALGLGQDWSGSTPPGEMFALMSANIPGMTMLDFTPANARETEFEGAGLEVHGFADGSDMLFYIMASQDGGFVQSGVDLSALVADVGAVQAVVLGVAPGQAPGDTASDAVLERLEPEEVWEDGEVDVVLAEGEILQIRLIDVTPTAGFAPVFDSTAPGAEPVDDVLVDDEQIDMGDTSPDLPDPGGRPSGPEPADAPAPEAPEEQSLGLGFGESARGPHPEAAAEVSDWGADWTRFEAFRDQGPTREDTPEAPGPSWGVGFPGRSVASAPDTGRVEVEHLFSGVPQRFLFPGRGEGVEDAAGHDGPTAADPGEAAQELLRLMGFAPSGGGDAGPDPLSDGLFPDLPDPEDPPEDHGGPADDMGLGWALAVMPLLAAAGLG
ncbi:type I secretion protein [uncultured Mameliella sp.]|uniref:type I secretion protein n=1 Tax=uncultured Mameliella sp. TaxID=1447087 RepID=UPI0026059B61|nr:type I secretion protein [uncultured Mameliella sp.]